MEDKKALTAPCGLDCFNCEIYKANLDRIRLVGLERWIEEAGTIRRKYYTGRFVVGKGQSD